MNQEERTPRDDRGPEDGTTPKGTDRPLTSPSESDHPGLDLSVFPEGVETGILIEEFVSGYREHLQNAESALLALEANPEDAEAINTIFRAFHTIKGSSSFLSFDLASELAHMAENLFSRVREKEVSFTSAYAELALRAVDVLRSLVDQVPGAVMGKAIERPDDYNSLTMALSISGAEAAEEPSSGASPDTTPPHRESPSATQGDQVPQGRRESVDTFVRVRTDRLDRLVDMVGELVIAHSMVAQDQNENVSADPETQRKLTHLAKIVRDLQRTSLSMRMVPLRPTFLKVARQVRDLARKKGRMVAFVGSGEDTEIDRHIVDAIADPLVHLVRNAVDHGIEPPEEREKKGKPKIGRVELSAFHSGGHVVIRLRDDGAGLNRKRLVEKAVAGGIIENERELPDADLLNLIFEPGFSTAREVTEVSGRGVGMDVVRRVVTQLQGTIETESEEGEGTTFSLRLPLTMSVTDGMLVRIGRERFILPTNSIQMTFRPSSDSISTYAEREEMVTVLGKVFRIVRLHRLLGIDDALQDPAEAILVLIDNGKRRGALMLDELLGQQQVVAKPLPGAYGREHGVVGGAILGDGRVGLILDPTELLKLGLTGLTKADMEPVTTASCSDQA